MKKISLSILSVLLFTSAAHADGKSYLYERMQQLNAAFTPVQQSFHKSSSAKSELSAIQSGMFPQKLDHFNDSDARTFKQRFFLDSSNAKTSDAPVLYIMCGEGTCDAGNFRGAAGDDARKLGAHLILLEHRYYGLSQPFADLATENLKYLSTRQAIEDMAAFQRSATTTYKLTGKWIAVGGSYSGSLAAYYRLKHPELVIGALASSAPVHAKANFEEYDFHVANAVGNDCAVAMRSVVRKVEAALTDPAESAKVRTLFGTQDVRDDVDFLYVVADMGAAAVQYGMKDQFCQAIVAASDADQVSAYAQAGVQAFSLLGESPFQDSFQFAESLNPDDYVSVGFGARQWLYQSCTEYGYYQVAYRDSTISVRSARITREYHDKMCEHLFGITAPVNTDSMNKDFYEPILNPATNAILFTNGSNDPWSNLSIAERLGNNTNPNLTYFTIQGGAHCDDLGYRADASVTQAKDLFLSLMKSWLGRPTAEIADGLFPTIPGLNR